MNSQTHPTGAAPQAGSSALRPSRVRWHMMAMLTLITALTYLDRLNLGIAGHYIETEYTLSTEKFGGILSAFIWGYALFQIPGGWAGDRFGPRRILTFAIAWWSVFTAVTALAPGLPLVRWLGLAGSFVVVRFLIGIGEAATLPNANKIVSFWMGDRARGVGNSMFLMGLGLGGAVTPLFIAWMMERWGWRSSFYACGAIGILVALAWHSYATSRPEEHPRVNASELQLIRAHSERPESGSKQVGPKIAQVPWRKLLASPSAWALMLSYFCEGYPNYIFYTWFYIYLVQVRGLTVMQGGFWGAAPFLASTILAPLGGWFSDHAVLRWGKRRGRQSAVWVGMILAGTLLTTGAHTRDNTIAILLLAGAMGFNIFATATWWATSIDLAPNFSGSLSAMMNTCGNIGGALSPIVTAYIATHFGWTVALDFAAVITFLAAVIWLGVKADINIETAA